MNMIDQLNITDFQVFADENSDKSVSKIYKCSSKMILSDFHAQPHGFLNGGASLALAEITAGMASNAIGSGILPLVKALTPTISIQKNAKVS